MNYIKRIVAALLVAVGCVAGNAGTIYDMGVEAYNNGQLDMARGYFNQALKLDADDGLAQAYLGAIELSEEKPQQAIEMLDKAVGNIDKEKNAEFLGWTYHVRYQAHEMLEDHEAALADVNQAINYRGDVGSYYQDRGILHYNNKLTDLALADFQKAATLDPQDANNQLCMARCYIRMHDRDHAIEALQACKTTDPSMADDCNALIEKLQGFNADMSVETAERDTVASDNVVLPEFPGGRKALKSTIQGLINYPQAARDKGISGRVIVEALIDTQGRVTQPTIQQGVDTDLDAEALRVVGQLPAFAPATQNGTPVECRYTIPIDFHINP